MASFDSALYLILVTVIGTCFCAHLPAAFVHLRCVFRLIACCLYHRAQREFMCSSISSLAPFSLPFISVSSHHSACAFLSLFALSLSSLLSSFFFVFFFVCPSACLCLFLPGFRLLFRLRRSFPSLHSLSVSSSSFLTAVQRLCLPTSFSIASCHYPHPHAQ